MKSLDKDELDRLEAIVRAPLNINRTDYHWKHMQKFENEFSAHFPFQGQELILRLINQARKACI